MFSKVISLRLNNEFYCTASQREREKVASFYEIQAKVVAGIQSVHLSVTFLRTGSPGAFSSILVIWLLTVSLQLPGLGTGRPL
jgi:hypothetical protein